MHVWIGIGTNLGDRLSNLKEAVEMLNSLAPVQCFSSIYETEPWGYTEQPAFLNQVVEVLTDLSPTRLLDSLKKIERNLGREPSFHLGPRLIDLDILVYGDIVLETPQLTIPHPHLPQRAFVLVPLAEIAGNLIHPGLKTSIMELLAKLDTSGVQMLINRRLLQIKGTV